MTSRRLQLLGTDELTLERSPLTEQMYVLSPFVFREGSAFHILVRVVNRSERPEEKVARVHYASSGDGLTFRMEDEPVIPAGPEADDHDGAEDPTRLHLDGREIVFYSGWNQASKEGRLLRASGSSVHALAKEGRVLPESDRYRATKEPSVVQRPDGGWRMFFEYAAEDASRIGVADALTINGPWHIADRDAFEARPGSWDDWHLSPGPVVFEGSDRPLMFYNGGTNVPAWRIGWVEFDPAFENVLARSAQPLVVPPPAGAEDTDISFAASAVMGGEAEIWLYYSVSDRMLMRARIGVGDTAAA
ncbi:MAG: hypothetical protein ABR525_09175 [Candidatus Limnocylindria bacterium]